MRITDSENITGQLSKNVFVKHYPHAYLSDVTSLIFEIRCGIEDNDGVRPSENSYRHVAKMLTKKLNNGPTALYDKSMLCIYKYSDCKNRISMNIMTFENNGGKIALAFAITGVEYATDKLVVHCDWKGLKNKDGFADMINSKKFHCVLHIRHWCNTYNLELHEKR